MNHVLDLIKTHKKLHRVTGLSFKLMNMIQNKKYHLQTSDAVSLFFLFVCPVRGSGPPCFSSP